MFIHKTTKLLLVTVLFLATCALVFFTQQESGGRTVLTAGDDKFNENEVQESGGRTVLTVGDDKFNENEVMNIIVDIRSLGNHDGEAYSLSESTLEERREIVKWISRVFLLAEAAKNAGLHTLPEIAVQIKSQTAKVAGPHTQPEIDPPIKWQVAWTLFGAYLGHIGDKLDCSVKDEEKYYNAHKADFVEGEAVAAAFILTKTESDAKKAALEARGETGFAKAAEIYSLDEDPYRVAGKFAWIKKGMMPPEVEKAVMNGHPGQIIGPVQSKKGWYVILVGEHRPARQLTFFQAGPYVAQAMEKHYIETALAEIRKKHPVEINDEVLGTLCGIPAPGTVISE